MKGLNRGYAAVMCGKAQPFRGNCLFILAAMPPIGFIIEALASFHFPKLQCQCGRSPKKWKAAYGKSETRRTSLRHSRDLSFVREYFLC